VYVGGGSSSDKSGRVSRSEGNKMHKRSRNLFLAASVGPVDPSGLFLMIDQDRLSASQRDIMKFGIPPSKRMYHRAGISETYLGGTRHRHIGIYGLGLRCRRCGRGRYRLLLRRRHFTT
jgi:hypothetical protein